MAVAPDGKVYYRGLDNKLYSLTLTNNTWVKAFPNSLASNVDNSITVSPNGQVFYKTTSGSINSLYLNNGYWSWSGLSNPSGVAGNLIADSKGRIFYRTTANNILALIYDPMGGWYTSILNQVTRNNAILGNLAIPGNGSVYFIHSDKTVRRLYFETECQNLPHSSNFLREGFTEDSTTSETFNGEEKVEWNVSPNPSHTEFTIKSTEEIQSWKLYNLQGNLILSGEGTGKEASADVSAISSGLYLLHLTFVNLITESRKIQVEH
jgi:hypothetical protein